VSAGISVDANVEWDTLCKYISYFDLNCLSTTLKPGKMRLFQFHQCELGLVLLKHATKEDFVESPVVIH
jgi:hypothetical protein